MKEFLRLLRRFVPPNKKYLIGALFLNLLSAILNIFSFALIIPILQILFKMDTKTYEFIPWDAVGVNLKDIAVNNFYYYVTQMIETHGPQMTLLFMGLFLAFMTMLKTSCYFGSSAIMIPLRTGVVRDIRVMVYSKVMHLPLGFFSEERKGDIIARMSGDVGEIENSITSSLDMLLKNPILILLYFSTLIVTSWQLTLFTVLVLPGMGWLMGKVGKKLKRKSLEAQGKWSDTMSQLEETLGGLRIIKAFIAEDKMVDRFKQCSDELRDATNKVAIRQSLAHPMSEFLGTLLIVLVLWFGGLLILGDGTSMEASTFIFYMVILYSIINPLKDFAKAGYNIPKGLASMERVDKILKAENPIKEPVNPLPLHGMNDRIEFKDLSFSYDGKREVLKHVNLMVPKGQTIALVGQSGSGKSTTAALLAGTLAGYEGSITLSDADRDSSSTGVLHSASVFGENASTPLSAGAVSDGIEADAVELRDLSADAMISAVSLVSSRSHLFAGTLRENLLMAAPEAADDELWAALELTHIADFVREQPEGLDMPIAPDAANLSGGQRQRLAIARALLRNTPIYVFDEATSSVDAESEAVILDTIRELAQSATVIMITHRMANAVTAGQVVVFDHGHVVETGTHTALMARNGVYADLFRAQQVIEHVGHRSATGARPAAVVDGLAGSVNPVGLVESAEPVESATG